MGGQAGTAALFDHLAVIQYNHGWVADRFIHPTGRHIDLPMRRSFLSEISPIFIRLAHRRNRPLFGGRRICHLGACIERALLDANGGARLRARE